MRYISLLLFSLIIFNTSAQQINIKTSLYYESDSFLLTAGHQRKLDSIADIAKAMRFSSLLLGGYADATADSLYNIRLSLLRTQQVKNYLATQGVDSSKIKMEYHGENKPLGDNESDEGKQKNRRVDVLLSGFFEEKNEDSPKDLCTKDTTIVLQNGTQIIMDICEFYRGNCFEVNTAYTPEGLKNENIPNIDEKGRLMSLQGLIRLKRPCFDSCFIKPVKIRLLINRKCVETKHLELYERIRYGAGWKKTGKNVRVVEENGKWYYEFEINCPSSYSVLYCCGTCCPVTRYKAARGYRITNVELLDSCPYSYYNLDKNPGQREVTIPSSMIWNHSYMSITAINPKGDTIIFKNENSNRLKVKNRYALRFWKRCTCCRRKFIFLGFEYSKTIIPKKTFKTQFKKKGQ